MKISVLMPTYNDAKYIQRSIKTVMDQTYENWELIIVNDGSTDETETTIRSINDERIKYHYQENKGQLNALLNASSFFDGDIVLLFHSDDELANVNVFTNIVETFNRNPIIDGVYADYIIIDKDGNQSGVITKPNMIDEDEIIRKVFYHKGDNLIGDTFIVKREIFEQFILPNYIYDNTIYYVDYQNFRILNLLKIDPYYKYRVFSENYIHSEIGKFEVANGCFRTIYKLLSNHFETGPLFVFSNLFLFKVFRKLKLYKYSKISKGKSIHKELALKIYSLWEKELESKGYPEVTIKQNKKILHSIESIGQYDKALYIYEEDINSIKSLFYGKDTREFYKSYISNTIHKIYKDILETDYDHIIVKNVEHKKIIENILHFYSLFYEVKVERA
ncbi:glycosyltransferase [Bacillaceae bacterium CLA-AA-H227]|uniref:Glycosyltransferase n=1 Tax=Robertmurraya yapensis (ex Hitch et al 2024) TaxID=3133160 RepID=A0ACC6SBT1_9BACI